MRRLNFTLLATLQLCGARSTGFNYHEDLLAFPQYEVIFAEKAISEQDAHALLDRDSSHPTYSAEFGQPTAGDDAREANEDDANDAHSEEDKAAYSFQLMTMSPHQYLCSIPVIKPPLPENATANELAKAEEARELTRATAHGWELLADLEASCLYLTSGWWSYSFCNNREIVQFHALPQAPNGQPPRRDPHTMEYYLGRVPAIPPSSNYRARQNGGEKPTPAELQIRGDQRYLVQRLEGGTICDLTGRDRTIEVQYHCVPGMKSDRIGSIKEVTICAYLMVINTPRLCDDVAFLPPLETKANPITCHFITQGDSTTPLLDETEPRVVEPVTEDVTEMIVEALMGNPKKKEAVNVGGVVVGARNVLSGADEAGKPPVKLAPPRAYLPGKTQKTERFLDIVAKAASKKDGGEIRILPEDELEKLEVDPKAVNDIKEEMKKIAGDEAWRVEVVELENQVRELRGYLGSEKEDDEGREGDGSKPKGKEQEGSEEKFYKDEL